MKKMCYVFTCLFVMFMVSGCGNTRVLTCTGKNLGNNMNAYADAKYYFKGDKLSNFEVEVVFKDITVDNLSSVWDSFKEQFTEQNEPVDVAGYRRRVKSDDKNYTFSVIIDVDYNKISKETMDKYDVEDYSSKTYDEIKEINALENLTCK